jgi:mannitol-specific phosphotransferase system IIBC component
MTNQHTDRTLSKVDVAKTQLDAAIQAYSRGEDVIAVTLAGAAEEIFGALCCRQKIKNAVVKIAELPALSAISDDLQKRITFLNDVRNCLKHANKPNEDVFVMADFDSFFMIVRALGNAELLGITDSETMSNFRSGKFLK